MVKQLEKPYKYDSTNKGTLPKVSAARQLYRYGHLLGYVILSFMLMDYIVILIPFNFFDSFWNLKVLGEIIEKSYITLSGFILVFLRSPQYFIKQSELRIISRLSRLALFLGIIYFLFAPLIIIDSLKLFRENQNQINSYLDNLNGNLVDNSYSKENRNLDGFHLNKNQEKLPVKMDSTEKLTKEQLQITKVKLQKKLSENKRFIVKMALKWIIGTVIAGASFVSIWKYTQWARIAINSIDKSEEDCLEA